MNTEPEKQPERSEQPEADSTAFVNARHEQLMALSEVKLSLQLSSDVLQRAYTHVIETFGICGAVVDSPGNANVIVTDDVQRAISCLKDGYAVIQLTGHGFSKRAEALEQNPDYAGRFFVADGISVVDVLSVLQRIAPSLQSVPEGKEESVPEAFTALQPCIRRDQRVLVVDDSSVNREAAQFQFGSQNSLTVVESYKQAVDAILSQSFDAVYLDLLMPPEAFMLSEQAFARVAGSEFPAGVFVALLAAKQGSKEVFVVTDASHHDHPAVALLDYFWGEQLLAGSESAITFCQASTVAGPRPESRMKDWVRSTEA